MRELSYYTARPLLRTGDVVLFRGDYLISKAIRCWSSYSHAATIIRLGLEGLQEYIYIVEAAGGLVRLVRLSKIMEDYKGEVHILQPHDLDCIRQAHILRNGFRLLGTPYDYEGLFANVFGRVSEQGDKLFCSELAWKLHHEAKTFFADRIEVKAPRPGDLPQYIPGDVFKLNPPVGGEG